MVLISHDKNFLFILISPPAYPRKRLLLLAVAGHKEARERNSQQLPPFHAKRSRRVPDVAGHDVLCWWAGLHPRLAGGKFCVILE
jgi:hypothetical protein